MVRLFFGLRRPRVAGRGMDLAGTVVATGADAAALPIAGNTAMTILDRCRVGEGSRVLVIGAGGGEGGRVLGPLPRILRSLFAGDRADVRARGRAGCARARR
jgi:hypothetical protein